MSSTASSASSAVGGEEADLLQQYGGAAGVAVLVILAVLFFSSGGQKEAEAKTKEITVAAPSAPVSKKKKGKKAKSSGEKAAAPVAAKKKEEAPPLKEEEAAPAETSTASKKKKKKSKKKASSGGSTAVVGSSKAQQSRAAADDSDSDDDDELWRLQPVAVKKKEANDAAKRAAVTKEKEKEQKQKQAKKKEEQEKKRADNEARAARADEAEAAMVAAAAEEDARKTAHTQAMKAVPEQDQNGAVANGDAAGEKKKRKRKKKKVTTESETRAGIPAPPSAERWETIPVVEEWQPVGHKKLKARENLAVKTAAAAEAAALEEAAMDYAPDGSGEDADTSVDFPAGDDPLIFIGRGGCTIQAMQENSGARFHLDRDKNILTISGPDECVQLGLAEARAILSSELERKANEATEQVTWGPDAIKAVIGRGGSTIRSIQDATDVRIDADVDAGTLIIVGPREQVTSALTLAHNAAFGEAQDVLELGSRNAVNVVYGPNFQTIRDMQDATGCKLEITRGTTTLKLSGSPEAVAEAANQVRELLEANRGFDMTIEASKVGAVYGKGGETLRSIQDRSGVNIDVVRGPTHATVSVMGTTEATEKARLMLQRAIDGEVEVGPGEIADDLHLGPATAAIIGRGGSNVADLEKRHGVKINVRSQLRAAKVVGKPENVAAAIEEMLKVATPLLEAEKLQIKATEDVESGESAWQQVEDQVDDADGW